MDDFRVSIAASAVNPRDNTRYVHAISISQSVQSWTVIREHADFSNVAKSLEQVMPALLPCPEERGSIGEVRDSLQGWLTNVLYFPGARESPTIRNFMCDGANHVPSHLEHVNWINFSAGNYAEQIAAANDRAHSLDEMEMDDMFDTGGGDDGEDSEALDESEIEGDEEEEALPYAARYAPVNEEPTKEDAMDLMDDEIEMVDDIGSLAQSMGASHLGRSLQLQAQIANLKQIQSSSNISNSGNTHTAGVNIGGTFSSHSTASAAPSSGVGGGIGGAMRASLNATDEDRIAGLGDSFHQAKPVSPPRLDSFKVIKVIGKGSFGKLYFIFVFLVTSRFLRIAVTGKVFLVREIRTGEMFALKVLKKDNIIKRNQVEHTRTERNVLGYVNHPFIVGLNMAFQSKNKLYFVLDYCAGGELFFHLGKLGKFAEPRACFYAAEITLAIEYVHNLDVIYRDLKPENVLLDAQGHVRLTDFGLSKEGISDSSSGANSFCGTPEYLAPEILNRQGHGRAVDWWSLGALLYEMLTGLPPFYCRDREKLFEKIRRGELFYPRHLSQRAQSLLRGLLTRDPTKRLGSGELDAGEIKSHLFFADISWSKLAKGEIAPPWNPTLSGSLDTSQFDAEFTNMPICSPGSMQVSSSFGHIFIFISSNNTFSDNMDSQWETIMFSKGLHLRIKGFIILKVPNCSLFAMLQIKLRSF